MDIAGLWSQIGLVLTLLLFLNQIICLAHLVWFMAWLTRTFLKNASLLVSYLSQFFIPLLVFSHLSIVNPHSPPLQSLSFSVSSLLVSFSISVLLASLLFFRHPTTKQHLHPLERCFWPPFIWPWTRGLDLY